MIKLLLVDDEEIIREGIKAKLPFEQYDIVLSGSCGNAFDALDSMADNMPDILITDVRMPRMDGLELIERALKLNPLLQCVVLSGFDEFEYARRSVRMGVREYILKPCSREELETVIRRLCSEIRAKRKRSSDELADHTDRVIELAERLSALIPIGGEANISSERVAAAAKETGDEALLREAFICLSMQQGKRDFAKIEQLFDAEADWPLVVAEGLADMRLPQAQRRSFVNTMCDYVHEHYQEEGLSLQYLADNVIHMRADYIGREFVCEMGCKLSAYLTSVRMERAIQILEQSSPEMPIYEVADAVGLGHNPKYFSTLFRKHTGVLPREYVQNSTKKH